MKLWKTLFACPVVLAIACDDADTSDTTDATGAIDTGGDDATPGAFELIGTWTSEFGDETITESRWDGFCQQRVARYSNEDNVAILETLGPSECGGGFGRVVWQDIADDAFFYCTTTFGQTSIEAADNAPDATTDDLTGGCGGFAWSHLTRK